MHILLAKQLHGHVQPKGMLGNVVLPPIQNVYYYKRQENGSPGPEKASDCVQWEKH